MSSPAPGASDANDAASDTTPPLALPAAPANPGQEPMRSLKVGESLDFAELGPIIINSDGTTRRIANWDDMSEKEQAKTWERIAKRNKARLEELRSRGEELDINK